MKYPRYRRTYCPHCRKHTNHTVSIYKKGRERKKTAQGWRRFGRKRKGYGSFPRPKFHKNAKVNKKTQIILECPDCGKQHYGKAYRVKKLELQA